MARRKPAMSAARRGPGAKRSRTKSCPAGASRPACGSAPRSGLRTLAEIGGGEAALAEVGEDGPAHDAAHLPVTTDRHVTDCPTGRPIRRRSEVPSTISCRIRAGGPQARSGTSTVLGPRPARSPGTTMATADLDRPVIRHTSSRRCRERAAGILSDRCGVRSPNCISTAASQAARTGAACAPDAAGSRRR